MKKLSAALLLFLCLASAALGQVPQYFQPQIVSQGPINLTASAIGTTGSVAATLTGSSGKQTYICGFVVTSGGTTTAITGNVTVTGTVSGTMNFTYVFVSTGQGVLGFAVPNCIASANLGGNIVVNVPAGGAATVVAVSAWGYVL